MDKDIDTPLMEDLGKLKWSARDLADIVILDNHYKDEANEVHPQRIISSGMIFEKFSGPAAIA